MPVAIELLDAYDRTNGTLQHLTPAGHDFADSIRTQYIWDEVKEDIKAKGLGSATLDIVKRMVDKKIKKHLELE